LLPNNEIVHVQIRDLGKFYVQRSNASARRSLELHQDANGSVFVKDLTLVPVKSAGQIMGIVSAANAHREASKCGLIKAFSVLTITLLHSGLYSDSGFAYSIVVDETI
jgi:hypothetical protein